MQPVVLSRGVSAEAEQTPDHIAQPAMPDLSKTAVSEGAVLPAASAVASEAAAALQVSDEDTDSELLGIFLEEAREVVGSGRDALQTLAQEPANLSEQTVLRRAFHTLKGSSRMVGLDDFGQAGWAMEQMLNAWLAEQKAMPQPMQQLALQALNGFETWANAIEADGAPQWQSAPFRASADAMRLDSRFIALDMAAVQGEAASDVAQPIAAIEAQQHFAADALSLTETLPTQSIAEQVFLEENSNCSPR